MLVQRAAIAGATGIAAGGGENAGGDQQKKLDVVSNDLLKGFLARSGVVRVLASEEVGHCWCVLRDGNTHALVRTINSYSLVNKTREVGQRGSTAMCPTGVAGVYAYIQVLLYEYDLERLAL